MNQELSELRDKVVNRILVLTSILIAPAYLSSLLRAFEFGWLPILAFHSILFFSVLSVAIARKKISTNIKIVIISSVYLTVAYLGTYNFSIAGGYFYAIMSIAILSFLVRTKVTVLILFLVLLTFAAFAYGFISGVLIPKVDLNKLSTSPTQWFGHLSAIFSLIVIFVFGFGDVYKELLKTLKTKDATEKRYRLLFEEANDAITLLKNDGVFFDCNQKASEIFQYKKKDLIGKSIIDVSPKFQEDGQRSIEKAKHLLNLTMQGNCPRFEWQHTKANKTVFELSISLNKIELNDETYIQAILRDITEKKKKDAELEMHRNHLEFLVKEKTEEIETTNEELTAINEELFDKNEELKLTLHHLKETQAQLLQAEKMASLGTLTAGVSHEINNPLQYLAGTYYGFLNYFEKHGSHDEQTTSLLLSSTDTAIKRISEIVKGLNQFSRDNSNLNEDCDIHTIIDNCLTILHNQTKEKAVIEKDYSSEAVVLKGNVGKLHQVFTNVLSNAAQAIDKHDKISIKTRKTENSAKIEITDTGHGISEEILSKITDPFFTTKDPGKGTGLGLSITYSIIQDHNGTISFASEVNKGTKVSIILPLNTQQHEREN